LVALLWQPGLYCKSHPVADAVCFDLLTFFDEDERGALETAQDFESNL
jgi:hypothetical protein